MCQRALGPRRAIVRWKINIPEAGLKIGPKRRLVIQKKQLFSPLNRFRHFLGRTKHFFV